jgi:hypothetical protein
LIGEFCPFQMHQIVHTSANRFHAALAGLGSHPNADEVGAEFEDPARLQISR